MRFRLRREMREARERRMHATRGGCGHGAPAEKLREGDAAEAESGVAEKLAARLQELMFEDRVHVSCG